jgi:aminoglycoside phosphotransferase family enzyme
MKQIDIALHLKEKGAFPHRVSTVRVLETHISWVLLTGKYVYKVKKEVQFGRILDFSTLSLRKYFCQKEVMLNRPLCGKMYQGVVKIVKIDHKYKIVNLNACGKPLEFAVKMLEIPQRFRMDNLLRLRRINIRVLDLLVENIVAFHRRACTTDTIAKFGRPHIMKSKIRENFATLSEFTKIDSIFEKRLNQFVRNNSELFARRIEASRIRDIHGDLYMRNIFFFKGRFYMYDRIEFNDSLRYADVAEDVSHLAMDLDYHRRQDLRCYLINHYIRKSNDTTLINIIYFMMCYKACIRAKVSIFRATEVGNENERLECMTEAQSLLKLARKYLELF